MSACETADSFPASMVRPQTLSAGIAQFLGLVHAVGIEMRRSASPIVTLAVTTDDQLRTAALTLPAAQLAAFTSNYTSNLHVNYTLADDNSELFV